LARSLPPGGAPSQTGPFSRAELALLGLAFTWLTLLVGGYAVKQVWVISRYLAPLSPVLLLAVGSVAFWLTHKLRAEPSWQRLVSLVLVVAVLGTFAVNGWLLLAKVRPHARAFSRGVEECYLATGHWLRDNTPPDALVAALDIGAIGYASERRVLDLMGLVSPEILGVGREMGFEKMVDSGVWLQVAAPDYLVDRSLDAPRWAGRVLFGVRFELLRTCTVAGVGLREPQTWQVALYRLSPALGAD
jgi:hypothetical protein